MSGRATKEQTERDEMLNMINGSSLREKTMTGAEKEMEKQEYNTPALPLQYESDSGHCPREDDREA